MGLAFWSIPHLGGDGFGGEGVVSGNHHGADSSGVTVLHRLLYFRSRRIGKSYQAQQNQVLFPSSPSCQGRQAAASTRSPF